MVNDNTFMTAAEMIAHALTRISHGGAEPTGLEGHAMEVRDAMDRMSSSITEAAERIAGALEEVAMAISRTKSPD